MENVVCYQHLVAGGGPHPSSHLGEQSPPLPVSQLQIRSTVPLKNLEGTELLLLLRKGPKLKKQTTKKKSEKCVCVSL